MSKFNTPSMQTAITIVVIIKNLYLNTYLVFVCFYSAFTQFVEQSEFTRLRAERFWNCQTEHTFVTASS
jgi:hypothetical protein